MSKKEQLIQFNKAAAAFINRKPDYPSGKPDPTQAEEAEETVKPEKTYNDIFRKTVKKSY
jgi:hypothetical protein